MCEFISAIEMPEGEIKFLTYHQIFETERGKWLQEQIDAPDLLGHLAIRKYYRISEGMGKEREYTNFTSPANFPAVIALAIKNLEFKGLGWSDDLLSAEAKEKRRASAELSKAYAERKKADVEWLKAYAEKAGAERKKADVEWLKAYAELRMVEARIGWDLFTNPENRNPLWR